MNVIIHPDEIFLKGSNQPFFYRCLMANLRSLFSGIRAARIESGLWVENFSAAELGRLALIPGIANFAKAAKCASDFKEIKKQVDEFIDGLGDDEKGISSFRISCERSFKKYPLSSAQIEKEIGEYVRLKTGWGVDLSAPDINIHIAIGKDSARIYGNTVAGAGGLPTGSSGKVLCLISGGIDSPVAVYKMMCRGAQVGLIHFQNQTQVSAEVGQKIYDLTKVLANYQSNVELFMVPFGELQRQIIMKIPSQYRMIITRRLFNVIAEKIAKENKYLALVSGDSLGQVASQTIENLSVIYQADDLLKLSPLIGANKRDIISLARKIGTLEISNRPYEDCCSLFVAKHPETRAKLPDVERLEKAVDISALDRKAIISYHVSIN